MDRERLLISERIEEITMMCARENPVYEQISSYSIALYALGCFDSPDLMSFQDVDAQGAAAILRDAFTEIKPEELPSEYNIRDYRDQYLVVIGDPLFPEHFAVLTDTGKQRPYFSKLRYFGAGFDTLPELITEFSGEGRCTDIHFFRKNRVAAKPPVSNGKIYIVKNDGSYLSLDN